MLEQRVTIHPPTERSQRFGGWILLGTILLMFGSFWWALTISRPQIQPYERARIHFIGVMLLIFVGVVLVFGARMAFETQTYIAGADYFERQSQILILKRRVIYRATAWRVEHRNHNGANYVLSPVGARVGMFFIPFFASTDPCIALDLGRQLANITGWPLRLSSEMQRLEKDLAKEFHT